MCTHKLYWDEMTAVDLVPPYVYSIRFGTSFFKCIYIFLNGGLGTGFPPLQIWLRCLGGCRLHGPFFTPWYILGPRLNVRVVLVVATGPLYHLRSGHCESHYPIGWFRWLPLCGFWWTDSGLCRPIGEEKEDSFHRILKFIKSKWAVVEKPVPGWGDLPMTARDKPILSCRC